MSISRFHSSLGALLVAASLSVTGSPVAAGVPLATQVTAPTANSLASAPLAKASSCTARLRGKAHLRSHPKEETAGPLLAAGTALEVLRSVPDVRRNQLFLYQVRVPASGATGYLFLRESELDASCPLVWPSKDDKKPSEPVSAPSGKDGCYKRGVFSSRRQLISSACWGKESAKKLEAPVERLDGDFTGQVTTFNRDADSEFGLVFHNKQGWRAYLVEVQDSDRHQYDWQPLLHAGRATYLVLTDASDYDEEAGDTETYTLFRLLSDGRLFEVLRLPLYPEGAGETLACKLRGNADESVTFLCRSGRSQTFSWDAAVNRLVPRLP